MINLACFVTSLLNYIGKSTWNQFGINLESTWNQLGINYQLGFTLDSLADRDVQVYILLSAVRPCCHHFLALHTAYLPDKHTAAACQRALPEMSGLGSQSAGVHDGTAPPSRSSATLRLAWSA